MNGINIIDSSKRKTPGELFFTEDELEAIEREHEGGLSSDEIVDLLARRGMRFSEATFRKYVQLGLLPRSRRVGSKGKHKGSHGLYPPGVVRQINDIKRMMSLDYTIEEIRSHFAFVGGEIEELRTILLRIIERLEASLAAGGHGDVAVSGLEAEISEARAAAEALVRKLTHAARRIKELKQVAREAV